jgi:hypothetical protein
MARITLRTKTPIPDAIRAQVAAWAEELNGEFDVTEPKLTVKIIHDQDPFNPRVEHDNPGVMYCEHSRYILGDKNADNPVEEIEGGCLDGIWMDNDEISVAIDLLDLQARQYRFSEGIGDTDIIAEYGMWTADSIQAVIEELHDIYDSDVRRAFRSDLALCIPLYLYDHGDITISHGRFSCMWDSGQVGWHYITKDTLDREWGGDIKTARRCLEGELEEYDHYLRGNVWCFVIEDEEGDVVESCSGFIGDDLEKTGMLEYIDKSLHDAAREAWDEKFDS